MFRSSLPILILFALLVVHPGCGDNAPPPAPPRLDQAFIDVPLDRELSAISVRDILAPGGELKAVATTRGLYLPGQDGVWAAVDLNGRRDRTVNCLAGDNQGRLLVGTTDGLYESSGGRGFLYHDIGDVLCLLLTPDGTVWCGTRVGLRVMRGRDWTVYRKVSTADGSVPTRGLPHDEVRHLALDSQGRVFAGTVQGVVRFDPGGGMQVFTGSTYVPLVTGGLVVQPGNTAMEGNTVTRIAIDGEYMLIATNRGINRTRGFQGVELFSADSQEPARLDDGSLGYRQVKGNCPLLSNFVRDMSVAPDGRLLIASKQGVSLFSLDGGTWETMLLGDFGLSVGPVNVIRPAPEGFFVGGERGLQRFRARWIHESAGKKNPE